MGLQAELLNLGLLIVWNLLLGCQLPALLKTPKANDNTGGENELNVDIKLVLGFKLECWHDEWSVKGN